MDETRGPARDASAGPTMRLGAAAEAAPSEARPHRDAVGGLDYAARTKYDAPGRAARYARRSAARDAAERALLARVVAPASPGATALDVPCGAGRISADLLALGYDVTSADLSPAMRILCGEARRGDERWRGVVELDLDLPPSAPLTDADRFDLVVCFRFLHHLPGPAARARALASLAARTRGRLVVSYHHPVSLHHLSRAVRRLVTGRRGDRHALTTGRLAREAAACGLTLVEARGLSPYLRDLWVATFSRATRAP